MEKLYQTKREERLISARKDILDIIEKVFKDIAIEGHLFGSMARGDSDAFSDIDICITVKDEDIEEVLKNRFECYGKVGEIVHIVEPPQNSPIGGVQSAVLYKTESGLLIVDYSICPLSTAIIVKDNKKIFGEIDLPIGEMGFNPQKVIVPDTYRIDFFIGFIFNGIKKIIRGDTAGFDHTLKEYGYLGSRYGLKVKPLETGEQSFDTLEEIIDNIFDLSTEKQKSALLEIRGFMRVIREEVKGK